MKKQYLSIDAIEGEGACDGDLQVRVRILGQQGIHSELIHRTARKDLGDERCVARAAGRLVSSVLLLEMAPSLGDEDMVEDAS